MSKEQSLVEYITEMGELSNNPFDASIARRFIVEGRVKVNGDVITDPAFRIVDVAAGHIVEIDRLNKKEPV